MTAGSASAITLPASVGVEREVVAALALDDGGAGDAGDVAVQLVRRLERDDACGRARRTSSSNVCSTSFDPLAAKTCSAPARRASRRSRRAARSPAGRVAVPADVVDGVGVARRATRPAAGTATRWCSAGPRRRPGASGSPRAPAGRRAPATGSGTSSTVGDVNRRGAIVGRMSSTDVSTTAAELSAAAEAIGRLPAAGRRPRQPHLGTERDDLRDGDLRSGAIAAHVAERAAAAGRQGGHAALTMPMCRRGYARIVRELCRKAATAPVGGAVARATPGGGSRLSLQTRWREPGW